MSNSGGTDNGSHAPLRGLRVVDFGQMIAVPLLGQWLGRLGAEVILVESRVNLPSRAFGPFANEPGPNTSSIFNYMNRNKRSCTLNLRTPRGVGLAKRLVSMSDVVQENFSPGVMERLGLGYEELASVKPDVILLSLSAFGATGPWSRYAALHSGVTLLSGLAAVTGYPNDRPRMVGSSLPDPIAAVYGLLGLMQALRHRAASGEGQHIDLSMTETVQALLPDTIAECTLSEREPERIGNGHRRKAPHGVYRAAGEDEWLALSVDGEAQWEALKGVIGGGRFSNDPRFSTEPDRRANQPALDDVIQDWAKERDARESARALQASGVPAAPVVSERALLADPNLNERGLIVQDDHPEAGMHPMAGVPWRFRRATLEENRPAPTLGRDNDYVFRGILGLDPGEIAELEREQVIH